MAAHGPSPSSDPKMSSKRGLLLKFSLSILLSAASLALGFFLHDLWPDAGFVSGLILLGTGPMFAIRFAEWRSGQAPAGTSGRTFVYLPWITTLAGLGVLVMTFAAAAGLGP